jgi:hypothetical protein
MYLSSLCARVGMTGSQPVPVDAGAGASVLVMVRRFCKRTMLDHTSRTVAAQAQCGCGGWCYLCVVAIYGCLQ